MTYMFELYYAAPADSHKEARLTSRIANLGGRLDCREDPAPSGPRSICLTYEFADPDKAETAADLLREEGEHIEGPVQYEPDAIVASQGGERKIRVTVRYGTGNELMREVPAGTTLGTVLGDGEVRTSLGYGENVEGHVDSVPQSDSLLLWDGAVISVHDRSSEKAAIKPRELIERLKGLVGLSPVGPGKGAHYIWKTQDGTKVSIPQHPGDLTLELLKKIMNKVGLRGMSVTEFLCR